MEKLTVSVKFVQQAYTWIKSHLVDGLIIESKPQIIKENFKN